MSVGVSHQREHPRTRSTCLVSLSCLSLQSLYLRILAYLVIYDSGQMSLEHLLLSRYPSKFESIISLDTEILVSNLFGYRVLCSTWTPRAQESATP